MNGLVQNDPECVLDINVSLAFLAENQVGVDSVINRAKVAVAEFVNGANAANPLQASDVALAAEVPGVVVLACTVGGAQSFSSPAAAPMVVIANNVTIRTVRMSYT